MITATKKPTLDELSIGVGVGVRTLQHYFARGCPRESVEAINEWRAANIRAVVDAAQPSELALEQKKAELKKTQEAARAQQLKNDEMEGLLVAREEIWRDVTIAGGRLRQRLQSLGAEVAALVPGEVKAKVKAKVEAAVAVALKETADALEVTGGTGAAKPEQSDSTA